MSVEEASAFVPNLVAFGRLLRAVGVTAAADRLADAAAALQWVDVGRRDEVYHTLRTLLVHRREQLPAFDRAFDAFWRSARHAPPPETRADDRRAGSGAETVLRIGVREPGVDASAPAEEIGLWSDVGGIADKDFAAYSQEEIVLARAALARLTWSPGSRRTRRWIAGRGHRIDLRRAIARSRRTGGELLTLPRRARRWRPRTLVVLCDVSGSMERYSRMLLHFAHAIAARHHRFEAFLFSTGLTRITPHLRTRRVDAAVSAVSHAVPDWSGGTRIGAALRHFHQRWSRTVLTGAPVVLLVSDGWDRGDPLMLRDEIARLQRSCYRLIWLNPLIGTLDYAPLTRGLQAALPFVDEFLPVRTLRNVVDLADHLNALGRRKQADLKDRPLQDRRARRQ
jgi:uncharacterized protein